MLLLPLNLTHSLSVVGLQCSSLLNQGTNSGNQVRDTKEGINQNKVKSMATQLLAKFEENAPSISLRRQVCVK